MNKLLNRLNRIRSFIPSVFVAFVIMFSAIGFLIVELENTVSKVHGNTTQELMRQRHSDLVLCHAINRFRPPPPKLDCSRIAQEARFSAEGEGH